MRKNIENLFFLATFIILFFLIIGKNDIKKSPKFDAKNIISCEPNFDSNCDLINNINVNLSKIKTVSLEDINIKLQRVSIGGKLFYEKNNKKIRILIGTFFGKELDIGANQEFFWFWSKRMNPSSLFYAKIQSASNTHLRPALSYDWVFKSFGFEEIDPKNAQIILCNGNHAIKESLIINEEKFLCISIIYKDLILGKHLYKEKQLLASVEYDNFKNINGIKIPTHLDVFWYEEKIFMSWDINNIAINSDINIDVWSMPEYSPKINIENF